MMMIFPPLHFIFSLGDAKQTIKFYNPIDKSPHLGR